MPLKNTRRDYGSIAKIFHWLMAVLILAMLAIGFRMTEIDPSPAKFQLYGLHKSIGILILALIAARFSWRLLNIKLDALDTHQRWERLLAHIVHYALYILIAAMPITGWLMSSAGDFPAGFFGLFHLPAIAPKDETLFRLFRNAHEIIALGIVALLLLHIAGAFKHHFLDRDETLQRMTGRRLGFKGGLALTALTAFIMTGLILLIASNLLQGREADTERPVSIPQGEAEMGIYAAPEWSIDNEQSVIAFKATQYGEGFGGTFKIAGARIFFDPAALQDSHVSVHIDIAGLSTGSGERDEQARGADWFDAARFPQASFVADRFEKTASGYIAHGVLNIRNLSRPLDLPFTLHITGDRADMNATLNLNRQDFGIGQDEWAGEEIIGHNVTLGIHVAARREK